MLTGVFPHPPANAFVPYYSRPCATQRKDIAIIGGDRQCINCARLLKKRRQSHALL